MTQSVYTSKVKDKTSCSVLIFRIKKSILFLFIYEIFFLWLSVSKIELSEGDLKTSHCKDLFHKINRVAQFLFIPNNSCEPVKNR